MWKAEWSSGLRWIVIGNRDSLMIPLRSWIYHGQRPDGNAVMKIRFAAFARMSEGGNVI